MKPLRRILDRIHPWFAKGGKYERFYPLYEAADTFLYTPGTVTRGASHVRDGMDMKRIMITVCVALIPCVYMAFWNTGYQANVTIHNRRVAEQLVTAGSIPSTEIGTVMQASIGRPLEENIDHVASDLAKKRARDYLASTEGQEVLDARTDGEGVSRSQAEKEIFTSYSADIVGGLNDTLSEALAETTSPAQSVELSAIGYVPDWRGTLLQSMGLPFDPGNFLSNVILGGLYFLPVYIVCMIVGGIWEVLFAVIRGHEINEGFLVTGLLFPLTLPPTIPLWQVALGISFGVVIGKEIFGGTGRNFLNPALTARAFVYFAYPAQSTGEGIWTAANVDGFSGATSLGVMAVADLKEGLGALDVTWWQAFLGMTPGSMGETSELACLIGAAILIATGIASWRIMAGMLVGGVAFSAFLWGLGSPSNPMFAVSPIWHLVIGSFMFGLVFMATDPVSASMTQAGKWWFGALVGVMTILVRVINPAFPEGVMLAILFANCLAPLIDYFVIQANIRRRLARDAA